MKQEERNRSGARPKSRAGRKPTRNRQQAAQQPPRRTRNTERPARPRSSEAPRKQRRVIHGPDQRIPEVTYTMPRPFSRGGFLLKIATALAVALALMSVFSLFFKVDEVIVAGAEEYTPYMIKEASGIEEGDSLLGISKPRAAGKIRSALPYVKEVKISKSLPGTVRILVRELDVTYAIQATDTSWWLIDSDGRAIESIDSSAAGSYTKILGVKAEAPQVNEQVHAMAAPAPVTVPAATEETQTEDQAQGQTEETVLTIPTQPQTTDADRMTAALQILDLLEKNGIIGTVAQIDVTDLNAMTLEYGKRFHVEVGNTEKLGYKIAAMASAVEQLKDYEIGELDVSFKFSEKVIFNPERD